MKKNLVLSGVAAAVACCCWASFAAANVLVEDTWRDGNRNQPDAPTTTLITYAENDGEVAVDADFDLDLESRWFRGGTGTFDPVGPGGPLRGDIAGTSSASWTTYFTNAEGNEAELVNVGDKLCITWVFKLSGVNATNANQEFRIAVVDSPANRLTSNNSPGTGAYTGYALFGNMGQTFGFSRPWDLMTRNAGNLDLLAASGAWSSAGVQDGTNGNSGYANGVEYTYTFMAELLAGNDLKVSMRLDGTGLNGGANFLESVYTDTNPASLKFDTFSLRPGRADRTATRWDTSLFKVELKPAVPEPASLTLFGISALSMMRRRRL